MISILGPLMLLFDQSPHKLNTIHNLKFGKKNKYFILLKRPYHNTYLE